MRKIAFIGVGNMAGAILGGIIRSGVIDYAHVVLSDCLPDKCAPYAERGATVASSVAEAARLADCIVLSVKPQNFAEILPEERSRYYQTLLGGIAQAASATGELETDTGSYPARMSFKCFVPDFATVDKGVITLELPPFGCPLPAFSAAVRKTPFVVAAGADAEETVEVRFPEGYTEIEHLPGDMDGGKFARRISSRIENGALVVEIRATTVKGEEEICGSERYAEIRDWRRRAGSRLNRTISVRRK
jgi:hypothetical protein